MRNLVFVAVAMISSWSAHAACPAAPVSSPDELVIQMKKQGDVTAAWAATNQVSATMEGSLVWDDTNDAIAYCDGTNWVALEGGSGSDNLGNHTATQNVVLGSNWLSNSGANEGIKLSSSGAATVTSSSANALRLVSTLSADHVYIEYFPSELSGGRKAYIGFPHKGSKDLNINNQYANGKIQLRNRNDLVLSTSGTSVGIGTSDPSSTLHVNGTALSDAWNVPSDRRLKSNVVRVEDALRKIGSLKGASFVYKKDDRPSLGLIAQEVETVFPTAVSTNKQSGIKSVDYNQLIRPPCRGCKGTHRA